MQRPLISQEHEPHDALKASHQPHPQPPHSAIRKPPRKTSRAKHAGEDEHNAATPQFHPPVNPAESARPTDRTKANRTAIPRNPDPLEKMQVRICG